MGAVSVAVIGAGISGLVAALRLRRAGYAVTVLEGSPRIGGALLRGPAGAADAPVIDFGAESLLARRPEGLALIAELGLEDSVESPAVARAAIHSGGRLHPMPTGHVLGIPARAVSVAGLLDEGEVRDLARALDRPGPPLAGDTTVGGFLTRRLGRPIVERLVEPLLGGVYAGRVDDLSLRSALSPLWPAAERGEPLGPAVRAVIESSAGGPVVAGLRGGLARLAEQAAEALAGQGVPILTSSPVTSLQRREPRGFRLGIGAPGGWAQAEADGVVIATPAPAAARLLGGLDETRAVAAGLARVEVASTAVVVVQLPAGTLSRITVEGSALSGVLVPSVQRRLVKAMTFSSQKWNWAGAAGRDVVRLSVGRAGAAPDLQRPDADLAAACLADASALLDLDLAPLAGSQGASPRVIRWGGGLPQYAVGHHRLVADVHAGLAGVPGLELAGSVLDGVGIPACIATATAAAHRLREHLETS